MHDDSFGQFNEFTGERELLTNEWTFWDYLLTNVVQLIDDFTTEDGFLVWELEDPDERMVVHPYRKIDRVDRAKQIFSQRNAKELERAKGSYVAVKLKKQRPDDEYPNHLEFFQRMSEEPE